MALVGVLLDFLPIFFRVLDLPMCPAGYVHMSQNRLGPVVDVLVALISAVDSRSMPKATALLYTVRTVGVTLGVSIGGSIQIGSLAMNLRKAFADRSDREQASRHLIAFFSTSRVKSEH